MLIREVTTPAAVLPKTVQRDQRIQRVVSQLAANDKQSRPASPEETVLAVLQYSELQSQAERQHAKQLRQQLAALPPQGTQGRQRAARRTR